MMIKTILIVFLVICFTACYVIGCPTTVDGWTFEFEDDVDIEILGRVFNFLVFCCLTQHVLEGKGVAREKSRGRWFRE